MKKYTVWVNQGYEGWQPTEYDSIEECLNHDRYSREMRITKDVNYEILEKEQNA